MSVKHSTRARQKELIRDGARRFSGGVLSAWAAHRGRACLLGCWYCRVQRMNLTSAWSWLPSPRTSARHRERPKEQGASLTQRIFRNAMPFFRSKVVLALLLCSGCASTPLFTCSQTTKVEQTAAGVAHERTVTMAVYVPMETPCGHP